MGGVRVVVSWGGWEGVRAVVSWGGWVRRWSEDEVLKVMYW